MSAVQTRDRTDREDRDLRLVEMYRLHPSPGHRNKLEFAGRRMKLRLYACGVRPEDYRDGRVLDAGCGTGEYACWFASNGADVVGLDLSTEALAQARRYAEEHALENIEFREGSVLDLPFDSDSFDLVYCTGVLHHTPEPFRGFREVSRVARPGGKVLVSLYHAWGFVPRALRWKVARLFGGEDLDSRVSWGRRLFPFTTRKLIDDDLEDPESPLYDYFAAPRQSTHSVGEVLEWFDRVGLDFHGSFPPVHPTNYPALFRHEEYESIEADLKSPLHRLVARIGDVEMSRERPTLPARYLSELLWLISGVDIFSICGAKNK